MRGPPPAVAVTVTRPVFYRRVREINQELQPLTWSAFCDYSARARDWLSADKQTDGVGGTDGRDRSL